MLYRIGEVIEGEVTGIQPYGVFVALNENTQGLIHISEICHGYVKNLEDQFEVGSKIMVKIIDIDEYSQKISLSVRALDPIKIGKQSHKRKHFFTNRHRKIGFASIEKALPKWMDEALEQLDEN